MCFYKVFIRLIFARRAFLGQIFVPAKFFGAVFVPSTEKVWPPLIQYLHVSKIFVKQILLGQISADCFMPLKIYQKLKICSLNFAAKILRFYFNCLSTYSDCEGTCFSKNTTTIFLETS